MTLQQISVFLENKPGKLQLLTDTLANQHINLRALSLAEAAEFGIVRLIAHDTDAAVAALGAAGFVYTVSPVLGVAIPDAPGGLNRVLGIMAGAQVNIEYMYAFLGGRDADHAYMIFHVQDVAAATAALSAQGIACIDSSALALS